MNDLLAGIDIGGTKIAAALTEQDGRIVRQQRCPTPPGGATQVLEAVGRLIESLAGSDPVAAIGVGAPGVVDPDEGVVHSATDILPGWAGARVAPELRERFGTPIAVDNDVRAMAYGEYSRGAGRGHDHALYVSVGTGVGGALVREGRLVHGSAGTAGDIAHLLAPARGPVPCGCGHRDHLEALASGPAIAAEYARRTGSDTGALPEVADRAQAGDREARAALTGGATLLGRTIAGLVTAVDIDAVIVGGGVATIGADFLTPLSETLRAEVRPPGRGLPVLPARLGAEAPLVGAALLARDHVTTKECA